MISENQENWFKRVPGIKKKKYTARHRWKVMLKDRICLPTLNTTVVMINESIAFKKAQNK